MLPGYSYVNSSYLVVYLPPFPINIGRHGGTPLTVETRRYVSFLNLTPHGKELVDIGPC